MLFCLFGCLADWAKGKLVLFEDKANITNRFVLFSIDS